MADYISITTFKSKLTPKLHGANLNKLVGNLYDKMREAAATTLSEIDPPDTIQTQRIDNALYDKVYNYTCPSYLKNHSKIIDIRPIGPRNVNDEPIATSIRSFDAKKLKNSITVETVNGVKTLRIAKADLPPQIVLAELDSINISTSVTAVASGDASTLTIDTLDYVTGYGSLAFNLSGATGQGVITFTLPTTVDLSTILNLGSLFEWLKFPDASRLTNVKLRWGSADVSANYWEQTVTVPQGRTAFDTNAWDLLSNSWVTATKTGSPDSSAIKYLQVIVNYTTGAALTSVKLDSITASLGAAYEIVAYDSRIFKDSSTGALKSRPTSDSDLITLDEQALNIFLYETCRVLGPEIKGKNMGTDMAEWKEVLYGDGRVIRGNLVANKPGLYRLYMAQNQSDALPPQEQYYDFGDGINQDDTSVSDN